MLRQDLRYTRHMIATSMLWSSSQDDVALRSILDRQVNVCIYVLELLNQNISRRSYNVKIVSES